MRALPALEECGHRLEMIFPRAAFDTVMSNPLAAAAVVAMIYVDAIVPDDGALPATTTWVRPSMCLWLSDSAYAHTDSVSRTAWWQAARRGKKRVAALLEDWGEQFEPRYADGTRETLRDETFPKWLDEGAMRVRPGIKTTSSGPRWALTASFADLFDPQLATDELIAAIDAWRDAHMSPGGRLKALTAQQREQRTHAIRVELPDGEIRSLEPGEASVILKGVIEVWAPARLADPVVLTISEPGDKIYTADNTVLLRLGLAIDTSTLLPDAVLVDIAAEPPAFWIVEAVASDGPIDEDRKRALLRWAVSQRIPESDCRFLTAFGSRNSGPARRRLKDLAVGTYAWYADEPTRELAWYELTG
jgi:hypothetical protein